MGLLAGSIRLFVAIVASFFVIALIIGVVVIAPSLLLWAMSAVMAASYVIAAVEAFNRYRQRHLSSP
jgi:membrane protein implicated in regulation of membrane protease activity